MTPVCLVPWGLGSRARAPRRHGVDEVLASKFPGLVVAPIEGSDVTIRVPTPTGDAKARSVLLADLARLRELVFGAPFRKAFEKMKEGGMGEAVEIRYRPLEAVWIIPRRARVTVIFSLACKDAMDRAIARVIATEFSEAQRKASSAPPVTFTEPNADVPMELRGRTIGACPELVGYLSFGALLLCATSLRAVGLFTRSIAHPLTSPPLSSFPSCPSCPSRLL